MNDTRLETIRQRAMQELDNSRREYDAAMLKMRRIADSEMDAQMVRYTKWAGGRMMYLPRPR